MSLLVKQIKNDIKQIIINSAQTAIKNGELPEAENLPDFAVEIPADKSHGDFALNAALVWTRFFKSNPRAVAETLIKNADFSKAFVTKTEIAGPGFINLFLNDDFYSAILEDVLNKKENYGKSDIGKNQKVLVEFVSANPTGPMHIGNARGGALGDCLAAVMQFAGYEVEREFYINDAGNQIEKFGLSLDIRYQQALGFDVAMPEDSYHGEDIVNHAKAFAEIYGDKFAEVSTEMRRAKLVEFALPKNVQGLEDDLLKYRIKYDNWFRESSLHNGGEVAEIIELLKKTGHTYTLEDALWFKATDFGCDKDFVLVRSNGIPTYVVPDIAYHYNKLNIRKFDKAIDVLGADHHGYVPRLKATLTALGVDADRLDVVLMQMVRLVRNGETVKLSKRSGKAITLVTLLDEVPIDAARYIFNSKEPNTHLEFDLDLAVEQSSQNPVYYVQYAHARICSILRKLEQEGVTVKTAEREALNKLNAPEERELIRHIAGLTAEVESAALSYDSTKITRYAYSLATLFHKFYNACHVNVEDEALRNARISLCIATKTAMKNVLSMLKIDAPERM